MQPVSGISVSTPKDLNVANGTSVRLKCTFTTNHPVTAKSVTVSWNFRPLNSATEESVSSRISIILQRVIGFVCCAFRFCMRMFFTDEMQ